MKDEALGHFDPRPWHHDTPQRPKTWDRKISPISGAIADAGFPALQLVKPRGAKKSGRQNGVSALIWRPARCGDELVYRNNGCGLIPFPTLVKKLRESMFLPRSMSRRWWR
jgi:hypothetical protein